MNGKWIWNLMDEQTDFIMEMKMGTLMGNEFGKRLDYNEWMMGYKNNFDNEKRVWYLITSIQNNQ